MAHRNFATSGFKQESFLDLGGPGEAMGAEEEARRPARADVRRVARPGNFSGATAQ